MGLYEAPLTAVRRYLPTGNHLGKLVPESSRRAKVEGPAWAWIQQQLAKGTVVQADPGAERATLQQVIDRQIGVMTVEADTMVFYSADKQTHAKLLADLQDVFYKPSSADSLHAALLECRVTHVFVGEVEQSCWKCLDSLRNHRYFEPIYEKTSGIIYAVNLIDTNKASFRVSIE
jgi:uncharacterized membrane protein